MMEEVHFALSSLKHDLPDMYRQYLWFFIRSVRAKARVAPRRRKIIRKPNPAPAGLSTRKLRAWRREHGPQVLEYVKRYRKDGSSYLARLPQIARRQNGRTKAQKRYIRRKMLTISRRGLLRLSWTKVMAKLSDPKAVMKQGLPQGAKARLRVSELADKHSKVERHEVRGSNQLRLESILGVTLRYARRSTETTAREAHVKARKQLDYMMRYERMTLERRLERAIRRVNRKLERVTKGVHKLTSASA